jgi:hypothetical protein
MCFGSLKNDWGTPGAIGERPKKRPSKEDCSMTAPDGGFVSAGIQFGMSGIIEAIGLHCTRRVIAYT